MNKNRHKWGKIIMPFITVIAAVMFVAFLYVAEHNAEMEYQAAAKEYRTNDTNIQENGTEFADTTGDTNLSNVLTEENNAISGNDTRKVMNAVTGEDPETAQASADETKQEQVQTAEQEKATAGESIPNAEEKVAEASEKSEEAVGDEPEDEPVDPSADVLKFDPKTEDMNIIFVSDLHLNDYEANKQIGVTGEERAASFIEAVRRENEKKPVTAIFVLGDLSSDDLPNNTNGVAWFKENIVDELNVPVYCLPGNHDVKTDRQWRKIFGYGKNYVVEMGDYVFLCYDTFNDSVNKLYNTWRRTEIDKTDLKEKLEKYKDRKVFVLTHFLHVREDSDTYDVIKEYQNVKAVIIAHNHDNIVYTVPGAAFKVYTDGNFSKDFTDPIVIRWRFLRFDLSKDYIAKHLIITENNYSTGAVEYSDEAVEILMGSAPESESEGNKDLP